MAAAITSHETTAGVPGRMLVIEAPYGHLEELTA
jgi:hypothetical protein